MKKKDFIEIYLKIKIKILINKCTILLSNNTIDSTFRKLNAGKFRKLIEMSKIKAKIFLTLKKKTKQLLFITVPDESRAFDWS